MFNSERLFTNFKNKKISPTEKSRTEYIRSELAKKWTIPIQRYYQQAIYLRSFANS